VNDVVIAGAAMTPFGKTPQLGLRDLAGRAATDALADAGARAEEVGMVFFANAAAGLITGQEMIRGQVALRDTALHGVPIVNVENACASSSSAAYLAAMAVASGQCEVAIAVGAEKMTHEDKQRPMAAIASAIDLERADDLARSLASGNGENESGSGSLFMDIYASLARDYMERSGASERDFAAVAVKSHDHAALNPNAQYRERVTVDEVLESRRISGPLTLLMCSPIGDGAAAVVFSSPAWAQRTGADSIRLLGGSLVSGRDTPGESAVERAAARAYEQAGIGPEDVDVVELHDAAAPAELILYEELGLAVPGEGAALLASGATRLGGRVPVNPSGGLLSKGHPVGATGCAQLVELVEQLRGHAGERQVEGARIGLAENAGGYLGPDLAAACVTILARDR
jgi:acetyl-CoA acetyltransferase